MIIGKNTLTGAAAAYNTDAQCRLNDGVLAPTLTANQRLIEYHLGYGDFGASGVTNIQVALYDVTGGFNGATLVPNTTQTFSLDHDALAGNQWISITGLTIDLSAYEARRFAICLCSPSSNGFAVIHETVAGAGVNKSIVSTTPPATHAQSGTGTTAISLYAVTEDFIPVNYDPVLDTPQADVTIQEGQTGTIDLGANFSDANAGDTLTYSISPAMSAGFSFNTATGVIAYNGSQAVAAAKTYTVICSDGQGGSPATDSFSITVVTASFIVDSISTNTPDAGSTISINYSNAGAAVTASCSAGTLNKVSDNGTTAVFDVPVPPLFGDKTLNYNTAFNITFSDGTNTDVESITIQVPAGEQFGQIVTVDADGIYANDAGAAPGQYAHAKNISGDMVIDLTTGLVTYNPTVNNSFDYAIYDGVWGTYAAVAYTAETVKPVITLNGAASLVWVQNVAWVDPGATVTDNVDATRQITSSSAPNVSVVGSYSLTYNATDAAGNAADTVTRTVIVSSADTTPNQFTFVDVNNAELNTLYQNTQSITGVDAGQTLTATNGQVSNDNGATWSSSCQMVTGQTLVRASVTTTSTNSLEHTQVVTVNGISDTFSVTTKAAVTRTFSIGSSDPVVDTQGANLTHTYGIWQLFDKIPEDTTAVLIDSGINFTVTNGVGSVQTSAAQPSTNYIFVARDSGNTPSNYIRTVGQVA